MPKFLTLLLTSCTVVSSHAAAGISRFEHKQHSYLTIGWHTAGGYFMHDPDCPCHNAGIGYTQSVASSLMACDWSEHESDNEPGCGYREGAAAAEDADCHEDHE